MSFTCRRAFFSLTRAFQIFFSQRLASKIIFFLGIASQNLFFPGECLSKFIFSLRVPLKIFFSWRVTLKIYFFLEKGLRNLFFLNFLRPHPQIITGRPLIFFFFPKMFLFNSKHWYMCSLSMPSIFPPDKPREIREFSVSFLFKTRGIQVNSASFA